MIFGKENLDVLLYNFFFLCIKIEMLKGQQMPAPPKKFIDANVDAKGCVQAIVSSPFKEKGERVTLTLYPSGDLKSIRMTLNNVHASLTSSVSFDHQFLTGSYIPLWGHSL